MHGLVTNRTSDGRKSAVGDQSAVVSTRAQAPGTPPGIGAAGSYGVRV